KATKTPKVISNDDLGAKNSEPVKSDAQSPRPEDAAVAKKADQAAAGGKKTTTKASQNTEIATLKEQNTVLEKEIDLLRRELVLDRDTYYSNPDYVHDTAGKAKLDAEQQQIDSKLLELENLKSRLAELEKEL